MSSLFLGAPEALGLAALYGKATPTAHAALWDWDGSDAAHLPQVKRTVQTRLTKKFEGDQWRVLVEGAPELLRQTFVCEACAALQVLPSAIQNVELRLGSLYVTFHVTHDEDITQEEMDRRIEEFPFREMWRLYNQRDGTVDGLDAALQRIKDFEEKLATALRELDQERGDHERDVRDLQKKLDHTTADLTQRAEAREADLIKELAKAQTGLKETKERLRGSDEEAKRLLEALKREKLQAEKTAKQHFDLVNAIIQENKKEKEAKDREFNEALEEKDNTIRSLLERLAEKNGDISIATSYDMDHGDKISPLRKQVEEMSVLLEKAQRSEAEGLAKIQRLAEDLKRSEESRKLESISYENNEGLLKLQIKSLKDTMLTEDLEKRVAENRSLHGGRGNKDAKENATIVRQYELQLENLIGSMQDRLTLLKEEYEKYLKDSRQQLVGEQELLEKYERKSEAVRQTFRTCSAELDKVLRGSHVEGVPAIMKKLSAASSEAEQSSAAVKATIAMLDQKQRGFADQAEWLEGHLGSVAEVIETLQDLNKRAFERQLLLMNDPAVAGQSSTSSTG